MASVFVVQRACYMDGADLLGLDLLGLYESERGARARVYQDTNHWEGRLLWWPTEKGGWAVQLLVRDASQPGKFRLLQSRWTIERQKVLP